MSTKREHKPRLPVVPRDFTRAPFFAATKQAGSREIAIGGRQYQIGGFHPLKPERHVPALDIRHGRACFTLLTFREIPSDGRLTRFSMTEFCRRYGHTKSGKYMQYLRQILGDLMDCYIRICYPDGSTETFRIIERLVIRTHPNRRRMTTETLNPQEEIWIEEVHLSKEFNDMFNVLSELTRIRIDVLNDLTSPLAQTIYAFLPSRSHFHTANSPFEITLSNLLYQVSHPIPQYRSKRKQLFCQHRTPIVSQLDETPTLSGTLRVALAETADRKDYKLLSWVEKPQYKVPAAADSKLLDAWRRGGRTEDDYYLRISRQIPLSEYEHELLEKGKIETEGNERFFSMAKALLGAKRFQSLLGEAKNEIVERRPAQKTPTARLIYRIMQAIESG